jgi:hypothetical protein
MEQGDEIAGRCAGCHWAPLHIARSVGIGGIEKKGAVIHIETPGVSSRGTPRILAVLPKRAHAWSPAACPAGGAMV